MGITGLLTFGSGLDGSNRLSRPAMHSFGIFTLTPTLSLGTVRAACNEDLIRWAFNIGGHSITVLSLRFGFADPAVFQSHFL